MVTVCAMSLSVLACDDKVASPGGLGGTSNRVIDGGFERPKVTGGEYDIYWAGSWIGKWFVDDGAVDLITKPLWRPAEGSQFLDMDGSCGAGTIHQNLATAPGASYRLQFALAGNPGGPPRVKLLEVTWGDAVVDTVEFDSDGGTQTNPGWTTRAYTVTADATVTRLQFRSLSPPPRCYGALLDAVRVELLPSP